MRLLELMDAVLEAVGRELTEDELAVLTRVARSDGYTLERARDLVLEALGLREKIPDRALETERYYVNDRDVRHFEPEGGDG